tara:strand:+ start:9449 stop:10444 length:996 start_codon:yes stop_codon:yes gene_type:complete
MKIAIVLINWNGEKLLRKFLPRLIKYSDNASIYIIDNNSTDNSVKFVKSNFSEIIMICHDKNLGFAEGYNKGLMNINADIYCLINNDVEVSKDWLRPIIKSFKENPELAIAQPKILDYNNRNIFEYAGAAGGYIDSYGYPYCRGRIFNTIEKDISQYNHFHKVFWASGACFFIKSSVWKDLNGFDIDYFAHFEEIDLCWRAFNKDYLVGSIGLSKVYHIGAATLKVSEKKWYLNYRNSLILILKNLPKENLIKVFFVRTILDIISGFRFILIGNFNAFVGFFKAYINFYFNFYKYYKKRKNISSSNKNYWNIKSIVWLYFIKKKRIFSKLL